MTRIRRLSRASDCVLVTRLSDRCSTCVPTYVQHGDSASDPNTAKEDEILFQLLGHSIRYMELVPIEKGRGDRVVRKTREMY